MDRTANGATEDVRKDNDLTEPVKIGPNQRDRLLEQLSLDTEWLARQGIMDYSLLLTVDAQRDEHHGGVCRVAHECCEESNLGRDFGNRSVFVGLIDALQVFDGYKKGELVLKTLRHCCKWKGLSCVPPDRYQMRFMEKMKSTFV